MGTLRLNSLAFGARPLAAGRSQSFVGDGTALCSRRFWPVSPSSAVIREAAANFRVPSSASSLSWTDVGQQRLGFWLKEWLKEQTTVDSKEVTDVEFNAGFGTMKPVRIVAELQGTRVTDTPSLLMELSELKYIGVKNANELIRSLKTWGWIAPQRYRRNRDESRMERRPSSNIATED